MREGGEEGKKCSRVYGLLYYDRRGVHKEEVWFVREVLEV